MCGIVGYVGTENPKTILLKGLKRLEYRGYDSAGVAVINPSESQVVRSVGKVSNLEQKLSQYRLEGTTGMAHTRWATHGRVSENNSHPHRAGLITLVHNGIIENFQQLKTEVIENKRTLSSDTDTEILAHIIDMEVEKGFSLLESLTNIIPRLEGSYALLVNSLKESESLIGVSNRIPLWVAKENENIYLSSDALGLSPFSQKGYCLRTGEIVKCRKGVFEIFDFKGNIMTQNLSFTSFTEDSTELIGFEHYMQKEIFEQPSAILRTLEHFRATRVLKGESLSRWKTATLVGCGSARHAGLIGKKYLEEIAQIPSYSEYASEYRDSYKNQNSSNLMICISQSGETADTIAAFRDAKTNGLSTLGITNVKESTLARESEYVHFTAAGAEVSVASTKAFSCQLSLLLALSIQWATEQNRINQSDILKFKDLLSYLPELVAQTLQRDKQIKLIAQKLIHSSHFFFLGKGILYPIALESALKLKEISYAFAEAYPAGELKHGPLALIDENSTAIILAPGKSKDKKSNIATSQEAEDKMMSALQEVKSRGATVWTWGPENDSFRKESHFFTPIPSSNSYVSPILHSVIGQLFAYHFAKLKGREIDMPRNLAKSVTVE
jgi:glucosamine--fructose-6-phosphate aminotransferase (isomerizing)